MRRSLRIATLALPTLLLACDKPPQEELQAAQTALSQAQSDGADRYAPERFKAAQEALADAQRKTDAKDYRGALVSAQGALEQAKAASDAAAGARKVARASTKLTTLEIESALTEISGILEDAKKAKVPDKVFKDLLPQVDDAQKALDGVKAGVDRNELLEAQKASTDLKAKVVDLRDTFKKTLSTWQEEHQKGRRK
jgi:hypothetical protein